MAPDYNLVRKVLSYALPLALIICSFVRFDLLALPYLLAHFACWYFWTSFVARPVLVYATAVAVARTLYHIVIESSH